MRRPFDRAGNVGHARRIGPALAGCLFIAAVAAVAGACGSDQHSPAGPAGPGGTARIYTGPAATLDPAAQGDAGSAAITAQLYETLTTFDASLTLRPALATSWDVAPGATQITFHLRPNLTFSDGTPLRASDVVRSWLRIIDPRHPSPLASFMYVIKGAQAYQQGADGASNVGLVADDGAGTVTVQLARPASDFVDVVASPTFGVVPPSASDAASFTPGPGFVGSGGYIATAASTTDMTLQANSHYWAGTPAIADITLITDLGGDSPVDHFSAGDLDYTPVGDVDATWLAYDRTLGPALREVQSMSTTYYGFDARKAPFDDARVRTAFAMAVDWRRIALLASTDGAVDVATSMVPPGIPGRSSQDMLPAHDPAAARKLLADAGYPGGTGFPDVVLMTDGSIYDDAIVQELRTELGVHIASQTTAFDTYTTRLTTDPPAIWRISWVADYPGRNDFLGVLLGSDSTNDFGGWSSSTFDAAIAAAQSAPDATSAAAAFDQAEAIVRDQAPVVPISYSTGWALSNAKLLGADQNGLGIIRMAGLAWAP